MDSSLLQKQFGRIGARLQVGEAGFARWGGTAATGINVLSDRVGEYFDLRLGRDETVSYEVIDTRPQLRHLLLLARRAEDSKQKFLCGHDERHWFVCAVPGTHVRDVTAAMESLQPAEVRWAVARKVRRAKDRLRRHNEAFTRQGEWFFVPVSDFAANEALVFRNEPISRGGGSKPHMCQELYRDGGEPVMVSRERPNGITLPQYRELIRRRPSAAKGNWFQGRRNAAVYVRGRVWHPDHQTIVLDGWHRVLMNTEHTAPGREHVVFLD